MIQALKMIFVEAMKDLSRETLARLEMEKGPIRKELRLPTEFIAK